MVKKKQPDFQPKQLRVGKHLPKGRNITNTSFKAKKIIVKDQKLKMVAKDITLDELLKDTNNQNVSRKVAALKKVQSYIERNINPYPLHYSEVLRKVCHHLLDSNAQVRKETISVFSSCLDPLSTAQMNSLLLDVTSYLDCMMTHSLFPVRRNSLQLLSLILKSHPSSICHSMKLLGNLLNMISSVHYPKPNLKQRKLDDNLNTSMTSVEFRDEVFILIEEFLEQLVDTFAKKKKKQPHDEQRVYCDGKRPLHLPLYAGSGLLPAKLDLSSPSHIKSETRITQELRLLFEDLINISSDIITEETAVLKSFSSNSVLKPENVRHLNRVTQALCCFCDWYGYTFNHQKDPHLKPLLNGICDKLMKGFSYATDDSSTKRCKGDACNHLNLGIIYLYTTFIIDTKYAKLNKERDMMILLCNITETNANFNSKSMLLIIKIMRNLVQHMSLSDKNKELITEVSLILENLCDVLRADCDKGVLRQLHSFFIDIASTFEYKFLLECSGMKKWIEQLLPELDRMKKEKKYDKKLLNCINLICGRGEPLFLNILNHSDPMRILDYLKFEDDNFQYTAMNLITNMAHLSVDFLQNISRFILCDENLSPKTVVKFIHLLHCRFKDKRVTRKERVEFTLFLFNVGCDMLSVEKAEAEGRLLEQIATDYVNIAAEGSAREKTRKFYSQYRPYEEVFQALSFHTPDMCRYHILPPSPNGKRHSHIAQVCLECVSLSPDTELLIEVAYRFFKEFSGTKFYLPIHCATALLKLSAHFKEIRWPKNREHYPMNLYEDILVSAIFYTSIVTYQISKELLKNLGLLELERNLEIDPPKSKRVLEYILTRLYDHHGEIDSRAVLPVMRIIKFFYTKMFIDGAFILTTIPIIQSFENYVEENTYEQALLYSLYEIAQGE